MQPMSTILQKKNKEVNVENNAAVNVENKAAVNVKNIAGLSTSNRAEHVQRIRGEIAEYEEQGRVCRIALDAFRESYFENIETIIRLNRQIAEMTEKHKQDLEKKT